MLWLFKENKPFVLLLIPVLAFGLWNQQLLDPVFSANVFNAHPMPLYDLLLRVVPHPDSIVAVVVSIAFLLLNAYQITRLNVRYKLIDQGTFLPSIVYLLFAVAPVFMRELNPIFFANVFFIHALHRLFSMYKAEKNLAPFFEAALMLSIASLFYFPFIFFVPLLFFVIASLRSFIWREWVVTFLGVFTPYYIYIAFASLYDNVSGFLATMQANVVHNSHFLHHSRYFWGYAILCVFLLFVATLFSFSGVIKKISARKYYNILIFLAIFVFAYFFAVPATNIELLPILAFSFSFFFSNLLIKMQSAVLAELLFGLFLGGVIAMQFLQ